MNSFLFSSEKEKRNQSFCFLQINEKGMYDLEFILCFFQKKEKGMHKSEFVFLFCSEKGKGTRVSEFRFSFFQRKKEIRHAKLTFHFLVHQMTMTSAEIHFLEN